MLDRDRVRENYNPCPLKDFTNTMRGWRQVNIVMLCDVTLSTGVDTELWGYREGRDGH